MSNVRFECIELPWDTEYFGVKSARVNLYVSVNEKEQKEILNFCSMYTFVTLANYNNDNDNNLWIGSLTSAFLVDINMQFRKNIVNKTAIHDENIYIKSNLSFNEQILEIAESSFTYSRFINDPNLSSAKTGNIYYHWTKSAFDNDSKYFVVSQKEGKVAGYILFSFSDVDSVLELIAVSERFRGSNIGKKLVRTMESFIFDLGIQSIKVGTQINNIPAILFYIDMGFKYSNCVTLYHIWKSNTPN